MKALFKWIATAIEDKAGQISSKRIALFWGMFILQRLSVQPEPNEILTYTVGALVLGLAGLTIPEWFSDIKKNKV